MEPFIPITDTDKQLNIPSGLLSFSDAHYFDKAQDYGENEDLSQNIISVSDQDTVVLYGGNNLNALNSDISILAPSGLLFQDSSKNFSENSVFSNSKKSRDLSITDFTIFNPYIHYLPNQAQIGVINDNPDPLAIKINTSLFLNQAVNKFNIYSTQFR